MNKMSGINNGTDTKVEKPCLEHMQKEALQCLDTFPSKVMELNNIIDSFMPPSIKTKSTSTIHRVQRSGSISSSIKDYDPATNLDVDGTSYYSMSTCHHDRLQNGIFKKRYYRLRGYKGYSLRRRPGPLGRLITFIAGNIAKCTKSLVLAPSWYIIEKLISLFPQRQQLKNVLCGPTADWNSTASVCSTAFKEDNSAVGNFINVTRPATMQLIADTTILKRWLQALAVTFSPDLPSVLVKAVRITETIDCWAYELFFSLKCFQINRKKNSEKVATVGFKMNDDIELVRLWNRLIQLRNNYMILYETLRHDKKFQEITQSNLKDILKNEEVASPSS